MLFVRSLLLLVVASTAAVAQNGADADAMAKGKMVYEQNCLACHQADGGGVPNLAPPLIKGSFVKDKQRFIGIVLNGMEGVEIKGEVYSNPMPAFDYLSDDDISAVVTYVRRSFKNNADGVTAAEVKALRVAE